MAPTSTQAARGCEQRRLQHEDLSRTQLLDAAEEVFGRKGFHEATLKEIAELAESGALPETLNRRSTR